MTLDALLPIRVVCQQAGISRARVYELMAAGQFPPSIHLGASVRWSQREVQTWIQQQRDRRQTSAAAWQDTEVRA